jgi:hypothetical protein
MPRTITLEDFTSEPLKAQHTAYQESMFSPVAPEYTVGDVLLGSAYRSLVLGVSERAVEPEEARALPAALASDMDEDGWSAILGARGVLGAPQPQRQQRSDPPPRLVPLVPSIARYSAVQGDAPNRRWNPGRLLDSALATSAEPSAANEHRRSFARALRIDATDEVFARFVEERIHAHIRTRGGQEFPTEPSANEVAGAWRRQAADQIPAERFGEDINTLISVKARQTRRQWTALSEALLRLGLGTHMLWTCRLNREAWCILAPVAQGGEVPTVEEIEKACWTSHTRGDPFLELGSDAVPWLRRAVREYVSARIGINLVLYALDHADHGWSEKLGQPPSESGTTPAAEFRRFLVHVHTHREALQTSIAAVQDGNGCALSLARQIADRKPRLLASDSGPPQNLFYFLRYALGQLQAREPAMKSYDQAYLLKKQNRSPASPWPVDPGPVLLLLLVHCCCRWVGGAFTGVDDLHRYLSAYGIHAPAGSLQGGAAGRHLERLGLVVDSPDAGGGRLLVDPFPG